MVFVFKNPLRLKSNIIESDNDEGLIILEETTTRSNSCEHFENFEVEMNDYG